MKQFAEKKMLKLKLKELDMKFQPRPKEIFMKHGLCGQSVPENQYNAHIKRCIRRFEVVSNQDQIEKKEKRQIVMLPITRTRDLMEHEPLPVHEETGVAADPFAGVLWENARFIEAAPPRLTTPRTTNFTDQEVQEVIDFLALFRNQPEPVEPEADLIQIWDFKTVPHPITSDQREEVEDFLIPRTPRQLHHTPLLDRWGYEIIRTRWPAKTRNQRGVARRRY